jgi:hypothetical protein
MYEATIDSLGPDALDDALFRKTSGMVGNGGQIERYSSFYFTWPSGYGVLAQYP